MSNIKKYFKRRERYAKQMGTDRNQEIFRTKCDTYADKQGSAEHREMLRKLREKYTSKIVRTWHGFKVTERNTPNKWCAKNLKGFRNLLWKDYITFVWCVTDAFIDIQLLPLKKIFMKMSTVRFLLQELKVLTVANIYCKLKLKSKKRQVPCQVVCNKLEAFNLPQRLSVVNRLERVLVARRILFKADVTKLYEKQGVKIRRATTKYKHTHTSFPEAMNKELPKLLFKLQDAQELNDPEKVYSTWTKYLYKFVTKLNNRKTQMIGMKPKDAIKLDRVKLVKAVSQRRYSTIRRFVSLLVSTRRAAWRSTKKSDRLELVKRDLSVRSCYRRSWKSRLVLSC